MRAAIIGLSATSRRENNNHQTSNFTSNTTTKANATTTSNRSTPTRTPLRPPLQSRDHNAMMRGSQKGAAPLTAKSGNANMPPYDKNTSSRPLMPTLSASAKVSSRPPITPRVAGSAPVAGSVPSSRRGHRSVVESNTPNNKEDISTPVSAFLNNNITPRSGSRKVRVDSTNTTPTGTPNGTPAFASTNDAFRGAQDATMQTPGLGISGMDRDIAKRPSVSFNTAGSDMGGRSRSPAALTPTESKFFFASDAKTVPQQPARPPLQAKSSSSFFYASGEPIPPPPKSSSGSAVGSSLGEERSHPKFFHANGTPDLQLSPSPHFAPPRPGSSASTSSRVTLNRAANSNPNISSPPSRPISPSKLNQQASLSSLRNAPTLQSAVLPRPQAAGRGGSANNISVARRASIESSRVVSHGRSASMGSTGPPSRKLSGSSPIEMLPPSTPLNLVTNGLISTPEEASDSTSLDGVTETLQSPIKSGQTIEQLNELAANARRERKVLDLEITNSSLAAINRTLEREMRKQTAELRRYRRLSRSGRLSIASTSLRTSTDTLGTLEGGFTGLDLSDMSENEEEDEDEDEFSSSASDSMDDAALSPSAMAENDLRHRKKDEKRLQLDLSKHQQLLIDSQKMNQSLKRCLGWTEALISEGKKALEYQVRVSDVELGGRVLPPDEIENPEDASDNEGMSDIGARMLREARQKAAVASAPPWGGDGRDDRDSGIEIDGPQRERLASSFGGAPL